jgi:hypothetical protein
MDHRRVSIWRQKVEWKNSERFAACLKKKKKTYTYLNQIGKQAKSENLGESGEQMIQSKEAEMKDLKKD